MTYKIWTYHGEMYYSTRSNQDCESRDFFDTEDDMFGMIQEATGILMLDDNKDVVEILIELTNFFRQLCSKVNKVADLKYIQSHIALTLCHLEKIFPHSFFDIIEHLPIPLAEEVLIAGAV